MEAWGLKERIKKQVYMKETKTVLFPLLKIKICINDFGKTSSDFFLL